MSEIPAQAMKIVLADLTCWRCGTAAYQPYPECDSHVSWRHRLETEIEMHNAWRKRAEQAEAALAARDRALRELIEQWRAIATLRRRDEGRLHETRNGDLADLIYEQAHTVTRCADELDALLSRSAEPTP